jgi:hypothetical protein
MGFPRAGAFSLHGNPCPRADTVSCLVVKVLLPLTVRGVDLCFGRSFIGHYRNPVMAAEEVGSGAIQLLGASRKTANRWAYRPTFTIGELCGPRPAFVLFQQEIQMNYRIYVLDYRFQIMEAHDFVASNDISALDKGISLSAADPVEIWERDRLVSRIRMADEAVADRPHVSTGRLMKRAA